MLRLRADKGCLRVCKLRHAKYNVTLQSGYASPAYTCMRKRLVVFCPGLVRYIYRGYLAAVAVLHGFFGVAAGGCHALGWNSSLGPFRAACFHGSRPLTPG